MNEGTMIDQGKKYISGAKLAAEYNIESMKDGGDKEQITPYILDTLLEDSVENQIVYSIPSLSARREAPAFRHGEVSRAFFLFINTY